MPFLPSFHRRWSGCLPTFHSVTKSSSSLRPDQRMSTPQKSKWQVWANVEARLEARRWGHKERERRLRREALKGWGPFPRLLSPEPAPHFPSCRGWKRRVSAPGQQALLPTLSSSQVIVRSRRGNRRCNGHTFQVPKLSCHCSSLLVVASSQWECRPRRTRGAQAGGPPAE